MFYSYTSTITNLFDNVFDDTTYDLRKSYKILIEDGKDVIYIQLPGFSKDQIEIKQKNYELTIIAKCTDKIFGERKYINTFLLSDKVDINKIKAELKDGILQISCLTKEFIEDNKTENKIEIK